MIPVMIQSKKVKGLLWFLIATVFSSSVFAERIKDISFIAGVRANQLVGYGLVVGLSGSGDQTSQAPFTVQSMKSMLAQFGISLPSNVNPQLKNVAAVTIHAELPPFAKPGQTIDITVSSIGNAKSLRGGSLLMAPLKGADGRIYAVAQGSLIVGGLGVSGADGSRITVNIPSVGRIPNGAMVERMSPTILGGDDNFILNMKTPDFTTTHRVAEAINAAIGPGTAHPLDGSSVQVFAPKNQAQRVSYVSMVENLTLEPGMAAARVIVNSRSGTVVIGSHVRVTSAAITHGSLTVTITEKTAVSQPGPLSGGDTVVVPASDIEVEQQANRMFLFKGGVSLGEIVRGVNQVGTSPSDLVAILEALRAAGALRADLIVI